MRYIAVKPKPASEGEHPREQRHGLSLHEIVDEYRAMAEQLASLDLPEEAIRDTLEGEQGAVADKLAATVAVILNLEAEADAVDAAIKRLKERSTALKNRAGSLRDYAQIAIERASIAEVRTDEFIVKLAKNPPGCEIVAPELLPPEFWRVIPESREPDKRGALEALKAGKPVPGARLIQGYRLSIK